VSEMRTLLLLGVCALAASQNVATFLPFLWATPHVDTLPAGQQKLYHVPICSIPQYNGKLLNISADLQAYPWSPNDEMVLYIQVFNNSNFSGNPIAQNKNANGDARQEFSFPYQLAYGDLYLKVLTGFPPTSIDYTIAIVALNTTGSSKEFISSSDVVRNAIAQQRSIRDSVYNADITDLLQLLFNPVPFTVQTNLVFSPLLIDFTYCPTADTYQLDVIVVATDEKSSFSTYICTAFNATAPCSASRGKNHSDESASAINHISLPTNLHEFTTLEAAVYGVGNYNQLNKFIFSVSVQPVVGGNKKY